MEANWIEIKRFLNDYKRNIILGSIVIAILFAVSIYLIGIFKEEAQQEGREDFEVDSETLLNEAQPAYFQIYIEYEDGTAYGNPSIIKQYFNLNSIKEQIKKETGIDIKSIEEEAFLNDLDDEIETISVTRNDSSYLLTAAFNLGNEQDNLTVAEYYYDLLYSEDFPILTDKKTYVFQEPMLIKKPDLELNAKKLEEKRKEADEYSLVNDILAILKNIIVGFLLGIVAMIGMFLLKTLFQETLDYSFAYDLDENDKFILYDKTLENEKIISHFVAAPVSNKKIIVSEVSLKDKDLKLLTKNDQVNTNRTEANSLQLDEFNSLADMHLYGDITEIIIIIYPNITTRKWYRTQKTLTKINGLATKVIQINR